MLLLSFLTDLISQVCFLIRCLMSELSSIALFFGLLYLIDFVVVFVNLCFSALYFGFMQLVTSAS